MHADAGSRGGKTTGAKKRRQMKGVKPGNGSAGRANAAPIGVRGPRQDRFLDVLIAAREWLRANDPKWRDGGFFAR